MHDDLPNYHCKPDSEHSQQISTPTSIQERAQQVLREIDDALELAEKATPGPWTKAQPASENILQAHFTVSSPTDANYAPVAKCQSRTMLLTEASNNAAFIAASRTLLPASLRCLKTAIEGLVRTIEPYRFPEEDRPCAFDALDALCEQWEENK